MSQNPKLVLKMNTILHSFFNYFENVVHPAGGKNEMQKTKRKSSKPDLQSFSSPDALNMRASLRKNNHVRKNPAP